MGIRFFVDPSETDVKRFEVTGVDSETGEVVTEEHWIELRMDLSDREWSELEMGIASRANDQGEIILDFAGLSTRQLLMWVKSWSFYDRGNPTHRIKPSADSLGRLDRAIADQIRAIIRTHSEERQAQRDAARNPTSRNGKALELVDTGDSETPESSSTSKRRVRGAS